MSGIGTVLVLPGGAYRHHAEHEAEPVARWIERLGWSARVVRYPLGERHPAPLLAMRAEVARARRGHGGPVAVLGFSAGGHLAGLAALAPGAGPGERPDLAVLGYPVVSLLGPEPPRSRAVLLGEHAGEAEARALSLQTLVRPDAPPCLLWHTIDDPVVPAEHSRLLAEALGAAGVPHELLLVPGAVHGVGLAEGEPAGRWRARAAAWLARS